MLSSALASHFSFFLLIGSWDWDKSLCAVQVWFPEDWNGNVLVLLILIQWMALSSFLHLIYLKQLLFPSPINITGETSRGCPVSWRKVIRLRLQVQRSFELMSWFLSVIFLTHSILKSFSRWIIRSFSDWKILYMWTFGIFSTDK